MLVGLMDCNKMNSVQDKLVARTTMMVVMESLKALVREKLRLSVLLVLDVQNYSWKKICACPSSAVPVPFACAVEPAGGSTSSRLAADPGLAKQ